MRGERILPMSGTPQTGEDLTGIFEQLLELCERSGRRERLFVCTDRDLECYLVVLCDCDGDIAESTHPALRRYPNKTPRISAH